MTSSLVRDNDDRLPHVLSRVQREQSFPRLFQTEPVLMVTSCNLALQNQRNHSVVEARKSGCDLVCPDNKPFHCDAALEDFLEVAHVAAFSVIARRINSPARLIKSVSARFVWQCESG